MSKDIVQATTRTKECVLFTIPDSTTETLFSSIKECIWPSPGPIIMSDLWKILLNPF